MRLEISSRSDLALRALRELSARGERTSRAQLAAAIDTTPDFLARVMAPLVGRGWVESRPGRSGGYALLPAAGAATLRDLLDAVEGIPNDGRCVLRPAPCDSIRPCAMHEAWTRARAALLDQLEASPVLPT